MYTKFDWHRISCKVIYCPIFTIAFNQSRLNIIFQCQILFVKKLDRQQSKNNKPTQRLNNRKQKRKIFFCAFNFNQKAHSHMVTLKSLFVFMSCFSSFSKPKIQ